MKSIPFLQGSDEWLEIRGKYRPASEAPVVMGAAKHTKRSDLIRMIATGDKKEFSAWFEANILDRGHEIEAQARPIAEKIVGEELYPVTGVNEETRMLASFDGLTMLEDVVWECKSWNSEKAEAVKEGLVPECDRPQVVQQLLVSGAEKALYMVTDGTEENTVYCWLYAVECDFDQLIRAWAQFDEDVARYEHVEAPPKLEGRAPDSLPALRVELFGSVKDSNLEEFKDHALSVFRSVNKDLQTDADFADAEKTVKWFKSVEDKLESTKEYALSQTASIDELFKTIDDLKAEARANRLELDKLVKDRKKEVRSEILSKASNDFKDHVTKINQSITGVYLPDITIDIASAMKGKKTVESLTDAAQTEVARAKIEASAMADRIRANLKVYEAKCSNHTFLFKDLQNLVVKDLGDFDELVTARVMNHEAEEKRKEDEQRERIRQEEEAKARREAEAKAEQERQRIRAEEQAKARAEAQTEEKATALHGPHGSVAFTNDGQPAEKPRVRPHTSVQRPSDDMLISTLAKTYFVDKKTVIEWLKTMNFDALAA